MILLTLFSAEGSTHVPWLFYIDNTLAIRNTPDIAARCPIPFERYPRRLAQNALRPSSPLRIALESLPSRPALSNLTNSSHIASFISPLRTSQPEEPISEPAVTTDHRRLPIYAGATGQPDCKSNQTTSIASRPQSSLAVRLLNPVQ